jgi:hypothetical protein
VVYDTISCLPISIQSDISDEIFEEAALLNLNGCDRETKRRISPAKPASKSPLPPHHAGISAFALLRLSGS